MKTVSTLCATSTVGIAACGFALARPNDANDHLTNLPNHTNNNSPVPQDPKAPSGRAAAHLNYPSRPLPVAAAPAVVQSTSRKWFRRLSVSFSSSSSLSSLNSPALPSPTTSTISSRSRRSFTTSLSSSPSSRPSTRNKLVKRHPSHRLSTSSTASTPRSLRRPSTAVHQSLSGGQSSHLKHIHASRPSTSFQESSYLQPYNPDPVDSWRVFFNPKRQKIKHTSTSSGSKVSKPSGVRRIYPDFVRQQQGPTLVMAPVIDTSENDTESMCSDQDSLYFDSRPVSHMGEPRLRRLPPGRSRPSTSAISSPSYKSHVQRSFSITNFLGVSPSSSRRPSHSRDGEEDSANGAIVGICTMGVGYARRHSITAGPSSSYQHRTRSPTPAQDDREPAPPIQSISILEQNLESEPTSYSSQADDCSESFSPVDNNSITDNPGITFMRHRLSILSASDRASTLVGSEFNNLDSDFDFQSDTVFDSMRTRVSELTPIRADSIFDLGGSSPPGVSVTPSPLPNTYGQMKYVDDDNFTPVKNQHNMNSSLTPQYQSTKIPFDDDDDDGWSSDWDVPPKSVDEDGARRLATSGGLRQYSRLLSGSSLGLSDRGNTSTTSFGTAPEGYTVDGASMRETNSILDWNESVPTSSPNTIWRTKTIHNKDSHVSLARSGRRTASYHVRSQSMPVSNTLTGRVPLPSENWDDDFLDEEDGFGMSRSEMVIPRAIEERQASVIGHLGCVREFALLVEDLKRLREQAINAGVRFGAHKMLWDEADGIIALATLDDDEDVPPSKATAPHWKTTRPSPLRAEDDKEDEGFREKPTGRISTVLLPDDNIFGGNLPATPVAHFKHTLRTTSAPSSPSPMSRKVIDRSDPVEVAKSMMERMQQQHRKSSDHIVAAGKTTKALTGGKVHFDTGMLRELVVYVGGLKQSLSEIVDDALPINSVEHVPQILSKMDNPREGRYDLPQVKNSFDEGFGGRLERVGSRGMDFRSVPVGIA